MLADQHGLYVLFNLVPVTVLVTVLISHFTTHPQTNVDDNVLCRPSEGACGCSTSAPIPAVTAAQADVADGTGTV